MIHLRSSNRRSVDRTVVIVRPSVRLFLKREINLVPRPEHEIKVRIKDT